MPGPGESVSLRDHFERILEERDKRYMQMFQEAKDAAAVADISLKEYKTTANEFRGTLKDQAVSLITRIESENTAKELRNLIEAQGREIIALRLGESRGEGGLQARDRSKLQAQWVIPLLVTIALFAIGYALSR